MTAPDQPPSTRLRSMVDGYQVTQAIYVAATLGIADLLRDGARAAADLAQATETDADALYRLLRALAAAGVFREEEGKQFALTDLGHCLRSDAAEPVGEWASFVGRPYYWQTWGNLLYSVRTGQSAFPELHDGMSIWEWRAAHPDESAIFDRAMLGNSRRAAAAFIAGFDFGRFGHIADIGGGNGAFLAQVLAHNPASRGLLFDQPHVVSGATPVLEAAGVAGRCEVVGGSFFADIPAGADAYVMKAILHDWDDADCLRILRKTREACSRESRLLVLEWVVGPPNEAPRSKFSDLNMMVSPGGKERTALEWGSLFAAGGFRLASIVTTATAESVAVASGLSVIVGEPL